MGGEQTCCGYSNTCTDQYTAEQSDFKYNTGSPTTALSQIYAQLWIDQYRQPWDAWTLLRRTGGKTPMDAGNPGYYTSNYGDLNRFVYPDAEVSYNYNNWKAATGGTDLSSSKMWINP